MRVPEMVELLSSIERLTIETIQRLHDMGPQDFEDFLEQREALFHALQFATIGDEEKHQWRERVQAMMERDALVVNRMKALKDEAAQELLKIHQSRQQRKVYEASGRSDSFFYDMKN